ncbi:MAG: glycosyltransferase family 39 protein [Gemmataceae bacterium]|nr:glycosyltransferase family 39 protein [Gemmataceae bacterium]
MRTPWIILVTFCGILFFPFLGARDLTSSHEARAAQDAQMILDSGDWLVPRLFDQHLELQKPPLYYWLVAVIGWLNGGRVDVWAVRLPAALSALVCVMFLYFLGIRTKRPFAGLVAGLILASCLHFTWLAQVGRIDMPLTLSITVALGAFHLGSMEIAWRKRWHAMGYLSLAVGLLFKGPIAAVLPAVVIGAARLLRDRRLDWRSTTLWWGVPLTLAIATPWYLVANWYTQNQLWEVFFWYHNVERGLGGSESLASHPWWFYGPRMAIDLLPWSLAAPIALYWFLRNREVRQDDVVCFGLIWFAAIAGFLSLMRFKRADYLLPAYPGMAIFLGACAERWLRTRPEPAAQARNIASLACAAGSIPGIASLCVIYAIGWLTYNTWLLPAEERSWPYRTMAQEIRGQTQRPVVFFRAESHLFAYHLGQPVTTILEWENLEIWANRPFPVFFVMPASCADEWRDHLTSASLEEVLRTTDYVNGNRDRPLVVLRSPGKYR